MSEGIQEKFIAKLEEKYGAWSQPTAQFGSTTYGKIAKSLNISSSQFSKLIYGTATEGMYIRTIENIDRLIRHEEVRRERDLALSTVKQLRTSQMRNIVLTAFLMFILGAAAVFLYDHEFQSSPNPSIADQHPLKQYFEREIDEAFDSPFLRESEVQDNCPCSAFEGQWTLDAPFKLPLPGSRSPGLYYLAKKSDMMMRCSNINAPYVGKGKAMLGYEYLVSEIWLDTDQEPLIPKYFDDRTKNYTPAFEQLDFEQGGQKFKKLATLYAFNVNNFEIHPDSIVRRAELTGRYATDVDRDLARQYNIDVKHIVRDILGNLRTTDCKSIPNPYCDPNDLQENMSVLRFPCMYTIESENLGLGGGYPYDKQFRLIKQHYSDHLTCACAGNETE